LGLRPPSYHPRFPVPAGCLPLSRGIISPSAPDQSCQDGLVDSRVSQCDNSAIPAPDTQPFSSTAGVCSSNPPGLLLCTGNQRLTTAGVRIGVSNVLCRGRINRVPIQNLVSRDGLSSGDRMDSTRASGTYPVHTLTKILILELGSVRRHGGTLQHPVHSGNHGIALCTTTVHARMCALIEPVYGWIAIHRAGLPPLHS
jgi:hypothetical protein